MYSSYRAHILLTFTCSCVLFSWTFGQRIVVFIGDDVQETEKILHALDEQNVTQHLSFVKLSAHDQFYNANKICSALRNGTWVMVALCSPDTASQLQWYSQAMHVPLVMMSSHYQNVELASDQGIPRAAEHPFQLNMRPPTMRAVIDLITQKYKWNMALYVTDSNKKLDQALNMYYTFAKDSTFRYPYMTFYLAHNRERTVDYLVTTVLREPARDWHIILDTPSKNASDVINRLLSNDLIRERKFHFIIASLDFESTDFGVLRYTSNSMTCLTLIDRNDTVYNKSLPDPDPSAKDSSLYALALDSVRYALEAVRAITAHPLSIQSLDCTAQPYNIWNAGDRMLATIRNTTFNQMTGPLQFDRLGARKNYELNIVESLDGGSIGQVGTWNDSRSPELQITKQPIEKINKPLRVVGFYMNQFLNCVPCAKDGGNLQRPVRESEISTLQAIIGKDFNVSGRCYEGYSVDLLNELAKFTGLQFSFHLSKNNDYGSKLPNGSWIGGVGEIVRNEADLSVGDLSIISEREAVVDFTIPFMNDAYVVMMKRNDGKKIPRLFSFLDPFAWQLWLSLGLALMVTFVVVFFVGRIAPSEWHLSSKCDPNGTNGLVNHYTAEESLWLVISTLLQQGPNISPRAVATKIAAASWFAWALIVGATYTANLAAFLTVTRMTTTIETIEELSKQDTIHYGIDKLNVASAHFFSVSQQQVYKTMWHQMRQDGWITSDPKDGTERVRTGTYAYIAPRTYVDFVNSGRPCDTRTLGLPLFYDNYALAVQRDSPLRKMLSEALLQLNENGVLRSLEAKWFTRDLTARQIFEDPTNSRSSNFQRQYCVERTLYDECRVIKDKERKADQSDLSALTPFDLTGLFIILAGGLAISVVVAILEYLYKGRHKFRAYGISIERILLLLKKEEIFPQLEPALSLNKQNYKPPPEHTRNGLRKRSEEVTAM